MTKEIGSVMPFRYVEIENAPALKKENVRMVAVYYPYTEDAGAFKCSDEKINAVWELCRHTIQATSFGGVFVDGDRERLPYEADAYINQLGWYACTDDITLARYSHEYLILNPTWPTEWILFSVLMAWEDYWYTGDKASLQVFYEDLKAKALMGLRREDGLISTTKPPVTVEIMAAAHYTKKKPFTDIVDWPHCESDGYQKEAFNTVVNAFHARALNQLSELATVIGKEDDAKMFKDAAAKTIQSMNSKLIDSTKGIYFDGEGATHSALHANMFPLAFGLVPPERKGAVTQFIKSRGMACSVYGAQFLLEALFENGEAQHALSLMTADGDRSWTHMIERVGSTMCLEAWDIKYKSNLDWNHAWGAAPANILPRKVLGIEPAEPGFAKIKIQPRLGNLTWAEGKVTTVRGPVSVKIQNEKNSFSMTFEIPKKTTAAIIVPKRGEGRLMLDGKEVKGVETGLDLLIDHLESGKHEVRMF